MRAPLIVIGERTPGIEPPLANLLGRSMRNLRASTCGSANTSSSVLMGPPGTPAASSFASRSARVIFAVISIMAESASRG